MTQDWIRAVLHSSMTPEKKIELLQNEAIYQRQMHNNENTALLDAKINHLGGTVLASLDVRDAQGIHHPVTDAPPEPPAPPRNEFNLGMMMPGLGMNGGMPNAPNLNRPQHEWILQMLNQNNNAPHQLLNNPNPGGIPPHDENGER